MNVCGDIRLRRLTTNLAINDWEKIYDLPPHSSTITNRDPPPNIDVHRRLQLFEQRGRHAQRVSSLLHT